MAIDYTKSPGGSEGSGGQSGGQSGGTVSLTKTAPSVSLTKQESESGILRVNLNWNSRPGKGGLFKRSTAIDLDLGCLYEYADGSKGVVQALGNAFNDRHSFGGTPIVRLDGDDRSGTNTAGENLFVDLTEPARINRILVFALIYDGVPNWAEADGVVSVYPASGRTFDVRLEEGNPRARMCGIAMIANNGGNLTITRENRYVSGHQELDQAYGWGLRWTAGRK
ncbi:MAG: hypothetical protein QM638_11765 [Nocardioides sp.]|uniref:TerD family protein n=1 Tax=Nocardioides sp. TaxID=35761 RepID=UPI0039E579B3